jgi:hypothetical protein
LKNIILTLAAVVALGAGTCAASLADDTQPQLAAAYDGQCKAAVAKDGAAFQKFFDPKFTGTDMDGKQTTIADVIPQIVSPPAGIVITGCSFAIHNVSVASGVATATVTQTGTGTVGSPPKPLVIISESTDTWNVSGSPLQLTSTETGQRVTVDGKVVVDKGSVTAPAPAAP